VTWRGLLTAPHGKKVPQEGCCLGGAHACGDSYLVVHARVRADVVEAATGSSLGVGRPEDHPSDPGGDQRTSAHRAGLDGDDDSGALQPP
jgi:hypothetical protein